MTKTVIDFRIADVDFAQEMLACFNIDHHVDYCGVPKDDDLFDRPYLSFGEIVVIAEPLVEFVHVFPSYAQKGSTNRTRKQKYRAAGYVVYRIIVIPGRHGGRPENCIPDEIDLRQIASFNSNQCRLAIARAVAEVVHQQIDAKIEQNTQDQAMQLLEETKNRDA